MMKKILMVLLLMISLCACKGEAVIDKGQHEKYIDVVRQLQERQEFLDRSEFFDITFDSNKIENAYRFYVIIDNVRIAMYDVIAVAVEKGVDYSNNMAANIGIFEDNEYSLIPNQYNAERGFMKGISISGISSKANPVLYLLVEWHNKDRSITNREYIKIDTASGVINE